MILQLVWIDDTVVERVMPGISLHSGGRSILDKVIAFLWALWLMCGRMDVMRWICDAITSATTDMGCELGFVDILDLLATFILHLRARTPLADLSAYVVPGSRLLKSALRVPNWSHVF